MSSTAAAGAQTVAETTLAAASHATGAIAVASTSNTNAAIEDPICVNGDANKKDSGDTCGIDEVEKNVDNYHNATTLVRGDRSKRSTDVSTLKKFRR